MNNNNNNTTDKLKLSAAMRAGVAVTGPSEWWWNKDVEHGEDILSTTEACTLGAVWLGAIKAGVPTAPTQVPVASVHFLEWMTDYWPELNRVVPKKNRPELPEWFDNTFTVLHICLVLNEQNGWSREQTADWLEGLGY